MKILGWMHQKFRRSSLEALKDISICNPCTCLTEKRLLDDKQCYPEQNFDFTSLSNVQRENHPPKSFASLKKTRVEEEELEEESSAAHSELFHGFLSIGTLGADLLGNHPSTPTLSISEENIAEKDTEVTASELKLFNDELEKVLRAEAKDDGCNLSTGRNSCVSAGRSSHCSTITSSGKKLESTMNDGNGTNVCPLQGYLFGSRIELPETTTARKEYRPSTTAKKQRRPSLGELLRKTKATEENKEASNDTDDKQTEDCDKSTLHLVKKLLKKRMCHSSLWSSTAADIKLQKILHMFHKQVHFESATNTKKSDKSSKKRERERTHQALDGKSITIVPHHSLSKESKQCQKSQPNKQQFTCNDDLNGHKECWIRTDAEYLVLELYNC